MENNNLSKMADFISNLRKEKQLTQKDLAEQLGVTDKAVSKWERGLSCPDISLLSPLAAILGISVSELLNGERATAPRPEMEAAVETTLQYADKSTQKVKASSKWWRSIAIAATMLLVSVLVLFLSQKAIESGVGLMIFPIGLTGLIWLVAMASAFAFGKNKIATGLLCGFLIAVTTHIYTILNQDSLNNPVMNPVPTEFRTPFIPHYAVILTLLALSCAVLVASFLIQKKAASGDLVFLLAGLGLTSLIILQITLSAIMDYVDLNGLGVNPHYSVLILPTFLMTLLSLTMLAKRQIRLKRQG
ncbi:MAG: helix-turn-helix transcriptional regulator [Anaerolineaceae bacterium]|nr:helix-turn-helix transcriptional regulator [Anaerolineaceae bacterium]